METVIIVIHLMVVVALVVTVLLQRSEGGALGIGGGGGGMTRSRGTANVLTRATAVLAVAFFTTSMTLTLLARQGGPAGSILDQIRTQPTPPAAEETLPDSEAPPADGGSGILDQIRPPQDSAPAGPQVPQSQ